MLRLMKRRLPFVLVLLLLVGGIAGLLARGGSEEERERELRAELCPEGFGPLPAEYVRELTGTEPAGGEAEEEEEEEGRDAEVARNAEGKAICLRDGVRRPEPFADLSRANLGAQRRLGFDAPKQYARAAAQKQRLQRTATDIPGTGGDWRSIANGPVVFDDKRYVNTGDLASGLKRSSGRITEFAHDPKTDRVFAAVSQGGVWVSEDRGGSWRSIGDGLPTQFVGSVAWTPAGGGTLVVLTGDNAFGGDTYGGMGIYTSTDLGKTWEKAKGAPDGAMGFRLAVREDQPETLYAATGFGLLRSTDAGRSWEDVVLPTGDCAGRSTTRKGCFLANVVTDVRVQSKDRFGNPGGAVVAAVGWRAGDRKSPDGTVQAPGNGIYTSSDGTKGSFRRTMTGFAPQNRVGRVALGAATGEAQDHGYVYAAVQDSVLFNTGKVEGLDVPEVVDPVLGLNLTASPTALNGIYVSRDFGRTWSLMTDRRQFLVPANGSTLSALQALGFGPGIQAWYDLWIEPDPRGQSGGAPTSVFLGMEELWQTRTAGAPQNGPSDFQTVAPYSNLGPGVAGCILTVTGQVCGPIEDQAGPTIHPDQHGAIFLPPKNGGTRSTLLVGNDGGAYKQDVPNAGGLATAAGFGAGEHEGFNTLLPYSAAVAKDGTVYSGLQDNGTVKLSPGEGMKPIEVLGGDGTSALVDPDDSNLALMYPPGSSLTATKDGGVTNEAVEPDGVKAKQFTNPFVFDDTTAKRVMYAARTVHVSKTGIKDLAPDQWDLAVDLGTSKKPLDAAAEPAADDPDNVATALALRDGVGYVGFCGSCDPVRDNLRFKAGIATNAGGAWALAPAKGLPQRQINGIAIDPANPKTAYVVLGVSSARPYAPPNALGDDGLDAGGGYVYKTTDGGATFTDISGDLPKIGATSVLVRKGQVVVGTTVGAFASRTLDGGEWGVLGDDLPAAPVFSMQLDPANADRMVIASFGRGIWDYTFKDPAKAPAGCRDTIAPVTKYGSRARTARAARRLKLSGTVTDRGCGAGKKGKVARVTVSVARAVGKRCRYLQANGRLARTATSCLRTKYVAAKRSGSRWSFTAKRTLPAGQYKVWVRGVDAAGNVERKKFSRNGRKVRLR